MDPLDFVTSDVTIENENQSDDSSSGSSVFKTQCIPTSPKLRPRNPIRKVRSSKVVESTDSSSDSPPEPIGRPLTLKALIEKFKKKKHKRRKRKYKATGRPKGRPKGQKNTRAQVDKKQFKDKGPRFSFLELENGTQPLPWRKILTFEQAVARGFFNYIEKLKYEYHLKESLKQMDVGEDLEKEDLDTRRYKYLDDDGSISPIEESVSDDDKAAHADQEECDVQLVDSSCFIVSSEFPKQRKVKSEKNSIKAAVLSQKKALKVKTPGQKAEPLENEMGT